MKPSNALTVQYCEDNANLLRDVQVVLSNKYVKSEESEVPFTSMHESNKKNLLRTSFSHQDCWSLCQRNIILLKEQK